MREVDGTSTVVSNGFKLWGTIMVAICFMLGLVVYGAGRYSFGVFMKPLAETMSWSRTEISLAVTINLIVYALSSPLVGWLFDRLGVRKVMLYGALILAVALGSMYFVSTLIGFYFLYGVLAAIGSNATGRLSEATIVSNWFVKKRGLMLGVTAVAVGLGTAVMAPLVRAILDKFGWQLAFVAIGLIVLLFVWLPVLLFVKGRGKPEDRGFGPDGVPLEIGGQLDSSTSAVESEIAKNKPVEPKATSVDWGARAATRTRVFWAVALSMSLCAMADYIVIFHGPASFEDRGFSGTVAATILSTATMSSCVGRMFFGWLADRAGVRLGYALMYGIQLLALPLMFVGGGIYWLYAFALVWGFAYGAASVYLPYSISYLYGRTSFGSIYGWATMITALGGSLGGLLGGVIYDNTGSYTWAWYVCGMLWFLCILMTQLSLGKKAVEKIRRGPDEKFGQASQLVS